MKISDIDPIIQKAIIASVWTVIVAMIIILVIALFSPCIPTEGVVTSIEIRQDSRNMPISTIKIDNKWVVLYPTENSGLSIGDTVLIGVKKQHYNRLTDEH